jgi:hypothetical protein
MAQRAIDEVLAEARAEVAAGRYPDVVALRARLSGDHDGLARLDRVLAVHRGRARLAQKAPDPRVPGTRGLRTKPSVSGDMELRRAGEYRLEWDAVPSVSTWEVRISERADVRRDYALRETLEVAGSSVDLPLDDRPLRVHVVGRTQEGRLLRRAVVSGLTREGWNDRWNRR